MSGKNKLEQYASTLNHDEADFLALFVQHPAFAVVFKPYFEQYMPDHSLAAPEFDEADEKLFPFSQENFIRGHMRFQHIIDWHLSEVVGSSALHDNNSPFFNLDMTSRGQGKHLFYNWERASLLVDLHKESVVYVGQLPIGRDNDFDKNIKPELVKKILSPRMLAAVDLISSDITYSPTNQLFVSPDGHVWMSIDVLSHLRERKLTEDFVPPNVVDQVMKIRQGAFNTTYHMDHNKVDMRYRRVGNKPMLLLLDEGLSSYQPYPKWEQVKYKPEHLEKLKTTVAEAESLGFTRADNMILTPEDVVKGVYMHFPGDLRFE